MFVTHDGKESVVKYGLESDRLDQSSGTRVGRYEREHMCDAPANQSVGWRDPGYIHDGVMTNLKQGKRYYYKVNNSMVHFLIDFECLLLEVTLSFLLLRLGH